MFIDCDICMWLLDRNTKFIQLIDYFQNQELIQWIGNHACLHDYITIHNKINQNKYTFYGYMETPLQITDSKLIL
jgi:hypothetical protein